MGQKSAEAIVGKDVTTHGGVVARNKPGIVTDSREDLPCRRAELEERDVILMSFQSTLNPTGQVHGARHQNSAPQDHHSYCRLFKELGLTIDQLRLVTLWEPPGADPHARWCGGRGRKTPGYPIGYSVFSPLVYPVLPNA